MAAVALTGKAGRVYDKRAYDLKGGCPVWVTQYSGETTASPAEVFALLADPVTWPEWNEGVAHIDMAGPFEAGTGAVMAFPDGTELSFLITWVEADRGYADETPVPGTGVVVRVRHELTATVTGTRITYRVEADGRDDAAAEVGAGVSADFPAVIATLAAHAERLASGR
jgi:Polyketide cyclase / dehydrase and lipid transport